MHRQLTIWHTNDYRCFKNVTFLPSSCLELALTKFPLQAPAALKKPPQMMNTATACVCLHYLIKQHGVAEVVRIIKSSMSQEYCVTCWECFPPQASPKSATFHSPGKYCSNNPGLIILILNSCKLYVLIFHVSLSYCFMVLVVILPSQEPPHSYRP